MTLYIWNQGNINLKQGCENPRRDWAKRLKMRKFPISQRQRSLVDEHDDKKLRQMRGATVGRRPLPTGEEIGERGVLISEEFTVHNKHKRES